MTTAQLSSILKIGLGSPTTRVATVNGVATTNYTAPATSPVQVSIVGVSSSGNVTIDGASMPISSAISLSYYIGAGQSTAITTVAGASILISVNRVN